MYTSYLFRLLSATNVVFESKTNLISRRLGIPERPKKPIVGFYRFLQEVRPSIQKTVKNQREVLTLAATQWKNLDENKKKSYNSEYENEKVLFCVQIVGVVRNPNQKFLNCRLVT